jgi:hypothetical protein
MVGRVADGEDPMNNDLALEQLAEFASTRFERTAFRLHQNNGYVRVSAGGFRAVCVSDDAPLCEFGAGTAARLDAVLHHFNTAVPRSETAQAKPERRVQAHIVRTALANHLDLLSVLPGLPFDLLSFALDEVRLEVGDTPAKDVIRCDLLAVGVKDGRCEPVVIELKWDRQLAQLRRQLQAFSRVISAHQPAFEKLLGAAVGRPGEVSAARVHHVIVWPKSEDPSSAGTGRTRSELAAASISAVAFERVGAGFTFSLEVPAVSAAWPLP